MFVRDIRKAIENLPDSAEVEFHIVSGPDGLYITTDFVPAEADDPPHLDIIFEIHDEEDEYVISDENTEDADASLCWDIEYDTKE